MMTPFGLGRVSPARGTKGGIGATMECSPPRSPVAILPLAWAL
jgi:hypothetical protein